MADQGAGNVTPFDIGKVISDAMNAALTDRGRVNVVIAGRSGVGKSTLINGIFQGEMAETGQGRPVTPNTREITKEGIPLTVFDTRGLEMDRYKDTLSELERLVKDRCSDTDPLRHLHVAWVCIAEDSRRVEDGESKLHEMLAARMPVLGVITKARADNGFRATVQGLLPHARNVVRVRALPERDDEGNSLKPKGLTELVEATMEVVPEGQRNAFAAAQRVSVAQKKSRAHKYVAAGAASSAAIGASPIPFSDAFLIVPVQVAMLAGITMTFGLPVNEGFLTTVLASTVGGGGGALVGRSVFTNLLKLVPGPTMVVGGVIGAATAAALTVVIGETYIATLEMLFEMNSGRPPSEAEIAEAFGDALRTRKSQPTSG